MLAQERVLRQRTEIVNALCCSGSSEYLERVLDILLAKGQLTWEDYQSIQVPGRALHANVRQLLDLVYTKGVETCMHLLSTLKQVLPDAALCYSESISNANIKEEHQNTSAQTLVTQRPDLVNELKDCVDGVLETLIASGHFTSADCEEVKRPILTPFQQARSLLDHVRAKGEPAAEVVLQYVQQKQTCGSHLNQSERNFPKEFFRYQKKLSSSVLAQSCFISTYGGTSHMSLDDIYTESQLELPQDCPDACVSVSLEDIVGLVGTVNNEADTVLVSGDAGSGKSILLQRMHLLWARGAALHNFFLLFPFSCRRLNSEERELSVMDLLFQHCCWPDRDQGEIFQFILDHPHLILFTFDGLDELKQSFSEEVRFCCPTQCAPVPVLLFNLLQGCLMKGVRKIVSSRPEAVSPVLKKHLCKEVLLKGFSPSDIDCFVRKHHNDPTVAAKVLESLKTNTALLGLCHSPVLCWIVSQCHKELQSSREGSPKTITHVYLMILQHFLQHQSPAMNLVGFTWVQEQHKTALRLGQLAFEGIKGSFYIFSPTELNKCGVTEKDIDIGFLMQSKGMLSAHNKTFEFLHVTLQCFFAALYVVLSSNSQQSTISKLFEPQEMQIAPLGSTCFRACLPFPDQPQQILDRDAIEAKKQKLTNNSHVCVWITVPKASASMATVLPQWQHREEGQAGGKMSFRMPAKTLQVYSSTHSGGKEEHACYARLCVAHQMHLRDAGEHSS